jgi:hypothetical protein
VDVKGKGTMTTYLLRAELAVAIMREGLTAGLPATVLVAATPNMDKA